MEVRGLLVAVAGPARVSVKPAKKVKARCDTIECDRDTADTLLCSTSIWHPSFSLLKFVTLTHSVAFHLITAAVRKVSRSGFAHSRTDMTKSCAPSTTCRGNPATPPFIQYVVL